VGPCPCGTVCPWVVDGGDSLQIGRVAATILNKQSKLTRGGPPAWDWARG
jgi:hypothetical protein